jgi:hypothetical protein
MVCVVGVYVASIRAGAVPFVGTVIDDETRLGVRASLVRVLRADGSASATCYEAEADTAGRFNFDLPPGEYWIEASEARHLATLARVSIPENADNSLRLSIPLIPLSWISGQVSDTRGQPLTEGEVIAMADRGGASALKLTGSVAYLNPKGEYRLFGLEPGKYAVVVHLPRQHGGIGPTVLAYGQASGADRVAFIEVAPGQGMTNVDFLISATSGQRVSGMLDGGAAGQSFRVSLVDAHTGLVLVSQSVLADTPYVFDHVPQGLFSVLAAGPVAIRGGLRDVLTSDVLFGRVQVDVGWADQEDIHIPLRRGLSAAFRIQGEAGQPPRSSCGERATLTLAPNDNWGFASERTISLATGKDMTVTGLPPGVFSLSPSDRTGPCSLTTVSHGGNLVDPLAIDVSDDQAVFDVTVAADNQVLSGRVTMGTAHSSGLSVLVLGPSGASPSVRLLRCDADHRFRVEGLRSGLYLVAAFDSGSLVRALQSATRVRLSEDREADVAVPLSETPRPN